MEQLIVQIEDKKKAKLLFDLLASLDFVSSVRTKDDMRPKRSVKKAETELDFFSFAGIWKEREISLDSIRKKAWPQRSL